MLRLRRIAAELAGRVPAWRRLVSMFMCVPAAVALAIFALALAVDAEQLRGRLRGQRPSTPDNSTACADAATAGTARYMDSAATGTGTGATWANAWTTLSEAESEVSRGQVVCVADGSYGSATLNLAASGTETVTFKKATAADHGSDTGWSAGMGDGQAVFGDLTVNTPRWVFHGATRTETAALEAPAGYGFRVNSIGADSVSPGDDADFSAFSYMDVGGTWSTETTPTCANTDGHALRFVYNQNNLTFRRMAIHNRGSNNSALAMMHGSTDVIWDHVDFYMGWGKATVATPNTGQHRHTVKHSRFWNATRSEGTGCGGSGAGITTELGTYGNDLNPEDNLIYGNIFYGTASGGRNAVLDFAGSGFSNSVATGHKAFNNTFVGFPESPVLAHIYFFGGSGNEARNNLFYDITGSMEITANTTSTNLHVTASNPFIGGGYPTTLDFRLAAGSAARDAGTTLSSPYDVDMDGETRGVDGAWDVGAFEYVAALLARSGAPSRHIFTRPYRFGAGGGR